MDKKSLREKYTRVRDNLSPEEIKAKSTSICKKTSSLENFLTAKSVALYISINNEVDTKDLVDFCFELRKSIFLPKADGDVWTFAKFSKQDKLESGPFGILQPILLNPPQFIDVAIIPGVAFDRSGVRLGYGKGVYDRLLADSKAFKIGLGYDFQVLESLPKEAHDLVMDMVVTDTEVIKVV